MTGGLEAVNSVHTTYTHSYIVLFLLKVKKMGAVDLTRVTITSQGVNFMGILNKSSLSCIKFKLFISSLYPL